MKKTIILFIMMVMNGNLLADESLSRNVTTVFGDPVAGFLQYGINDKGELLYVVVSYHRSEAPVIIGGGDVKVNGKKIKRKYKLVPNIDEFKELSRVGGFLGKFTLIKRHKVDQLPIGDIDVKDIKDLSEKICEENFNYMKWMNSRIDK